MVQYYKFFGVLVGCITNTIITGRFSTIYRAVTSARNYYMYSRKYVHQTLGATASALEYCADDIVIFSPGGNNVGNNIDNLRVGVICPQRKNIYPLCCKEELVQDENFDAKQELVVNLYYDENVESCKADKSSVIILAILNDVQYSQRMIEDRVSNPHGEHAEDVWTVNFRTAILNKETNLNVDSDMERSMLIVPLLLHGDCDCDPWITVANLSLLDTQGTPPAVRINIVPSLH